MGRKYTAEHIDFIAANIKGRSYKDLANMFNQRFGMEIKHNTLAGVASKHGLGNGRDCRFTTGWEQTQFKKGHIPWIKGKKGVGGWKPTQFKKGQRPVNYKPVGTERVNGQGYAEIKIADPNKWKAKHIIIWEAAHGLVPKGYVIIFADGNQRNVTLENLLMISRKELAIMNKRRLIASDAELTKAGVVIADICLKMGERKKK